MTTLLDVDEHFAFGENWRSFADLIDDDRIKSSDAGIARLFPDQELAGKRVIDIGCGSGLPALSMLRAGAAHVTCIDIDPNSVLAAQQTLARHAPADAWSADVQSVFDLDGQYDVVHSWGVLHHTGAMWPAIAKAASLVKPGGLLCIAIYGKGPLCGFWRMEKRFYAHAAPWIQEVIYRLYCWAFHLWFMLKGKDARAIIAAEQGRGMDWAHDVRDWLGGYPYESATPSEIEAFVDGRGFTLVRSKTGKPNLKSGCDEYVFVAT